MFIRNIGILLIFFILVSSCQKLPKEAQFIENNKISGVIDIDSKLKDKCGNYLFIIVRKAESPQPIAVKRLKNIDYPYRFEISPADVMIETNFELFQGNLLVYAKTSKSGNPFEEGSYCGSEVLSLKAGSKNVKIKLNYVEDGGR